MATELIAKDKASKMGDAETKKEDLLVEAIGSMMIDMNQEGPADSKVPPASKVPVCLSHILI